MDAYLAHNVELVEALTMSSTIIVDEEVIMITLEGLEPEYDSFVTSFTSNPSNLVTLQELQGLLTDQERRMTTLASFSIATPQLSTNVVATSAPNLASSEHKPVEKKKESNICQICGR